MTSVWQPVDCTIGRSFKCALSRLIVAYLLAHVNNMLSKPPADRVPFKIHEVITANSAVKLIFEAWNLVPRRVVLKVWLNTGLLSLRQVQEVKYLLGTHINIVDKALKPQCGSATRTKEVANKMRSEAVSNLGRKWLKLLEKGDGNASRNGTDVQDKT